MPTPKSRMEPVPESQRLAALKGIVEADVDGILWGVSRPTRAESFEGHARVGDAPAAKHVRADPAWIPAGFPAWRERTGA